MTNKYSNPCIRCGKERVITKVWQETVGYSVVTTRESSCPDPECQKQVESTNKKQRDKLEASKLRRKTSLSRNGKSKVGTTKRPSAKK